MDGGRDSAVWCELIVYMWRFRFRIWVVSMQVSADISVYIRARIWTEIRKFVGV
jgi:hypothetical protein